MLKRLIENYYFLLILSIVYIIAFNLSSYNYFIKDFLELENKENKKIVSEIVKKIDTNLQNLRSLTRDYALWDDSYRFIKGENPEYIHENFRDTANTLEDLRLDFVLYTDKKNELVYVKYINNIDLNVYPEILKETPKKNISTIKKIHNNYYYFTKSPILTSDEQGPLEGYLYFGYKLRLEQLNNNFISIKIINNDLNNVKTDFKSNFIKKITLQSLHTDKELTNTILFQDENLKKIFTLEVVTKRDIYNRGKKNIIFFNSVISVFFIILFFIFYWNISHQAKLNMELKKRVEEEINKQREQEQLLIQQSKLAAMGEMIGNIAHQWRQPLNALGLVVQNIQFTYAIGELDTKFMEKSVKKANLLTANMSKTIDDFRNFFKPNKHQELFNLNPFIDKTLFLIESTLDHYKIDVIKEYEDKSLEVYGFPNEFSQVLLNIISNAKDALVINDIKEPFIIIKTFEEDDTINLTIEDNAGGIPTDILDKIFEPYFTTKEEGKGTGIGLYMSKTIVENSMKGQLKVTTTKKGSTFHIQIPTLKEEQTA